MDKSVASMNSSKTAKDPSVCALSLIDGSDWACVDFISDLHLQAREPEVFEAIEFLLENTPAQALFILGDLFELWIGDDELDSRQGEFARMCVSSLQAASRRLPLFLMPGNRDFLLSHHFYTQARVQALSDPTVLRTQERSYLLSHGDILCTSDRAYQGFRETVRSEAWQSEFLSQSLSTRLSLGQDMRAKSTALQREQGLTQSGGFWRPG
jgi:UDP-2,3-diacylglucosamine hydrolase